MHSVSEFLEFLDDHGTSVARLVLYAPAGKTNSISRLTEAEARDFGEELVQIAEGLRYEYAFDGDGAESLRLEEALGNGVVEPSNNPKLLHCGVIVPGLNVGLLALIARDGTGSIIGRTTLEVRSRKISYRNDYRIMLEDITEQCVGLLMDFRSPVAMQIEPNPGQTAETINQRFAFLRALIGSRQFSDALHRISVYPHQRWEPEGITFNTRRGFRPDARTVRQLACARRRAPLPASHPLSKVITSLPDSISIYRNEQNEDTPENRFIKFALQTFVSFLNRMRLKLDQIGNVSDTRLKQEIATLESQLETTLTAGVFRNLSQPDMLPLGSVVLQRKEGYREVYQAWLKFDMAARLVWHGGDDVYKAGQRDIATLYEYWVFFKLLDIVTQVFELKKPPVETLIEPTADGFGLKLKTGEHLAFEGNFLGGARALNVRFSYNRSFIQNRDPDISGSWTERMRPDYTISLWPSDFDESEAEAQELMVHVHFDAKYRIDNIEQIFGIDDSGLNEIDREQDLNSEKQEQREGKYKRADLLKMHAYHDAIRRTYGAYVLYPGDESKQWKEGYREILPGIGAFPLKPGNGENTVEKFIRDIVNHTCNRASLRERQSYHTYRVRRASATDKLFRAYPERTNASTLRHTPPAETFVLLSWNQNEDNLHWILREKLYSFCIDEHVDEFHLVPEVTAAQYLLIHGEGARTISGLLRIAPKGPRLLSKKVLQDKGYPGDLSGDFYIVFEVEQATGFDGFSWDYTQLLNLLGERHSTDLLAVSMDIVLSAALPIEMLQ